MADPSDFPASCPGCESTYLIPLSMAGQPASCASCQTDFTLPEAPLPAASTAALEAPIQTSLATAPPAPKSTLFKNTLFILSGAVLVWGLSTRIHTPLPKEPASTALPSKPQLKPDSVSVILTTTTPADDSPSPLHLIAPTLTDSTITSAEVSSELTHTTAAPQLEPDPPALPLLVPEPPAITPPNILPESSSPASSTIITPTPKPDLAPVTSTSLSPADYARLRQNSRLTLERFLLASSVEERLALSQNPDKIRSAMEQHYRTWPDTPQAFSEIAFLTEGEVPDTKRKFQLYNVSLKDQEAPIPLALEETKDGYRVDWPTFAESYTHALRTFFAAPLQTPARFRVMLRRAHYFGPPVPGQDTLRIAYTIEPPMRDETFNIWVDVDSLVYKNKLATGERATWDAQSYLMVELLWKGDEKQGRWVGLNRIPSDSWRPE